jgi:hypothetical protein
VKFGISVEDCIGAGGQSAELKRSLGRTWRSFRRRRLCFSRRCRYRSRRGVGDRLRWRRFRRRSCRRGAFGYRRCGYWRGLLCLGPEEKRSYTQCRRGQQCDGDISPGRAFCGWRGGVECTGRRERRRRSHRHARRRGRRFRQGAWSRWFRYLRGRPAYRRWLILRQPHIFGWRQRASFRGRRRAKRRRSGHGLRQILSDGRA